MFAPKWLPILQEAISDLSFLLTRGYGETSSLEIVGNRYKLNKRQRMALGRICESDLDVKARSDKHCSIQNLENKRIEIDGFNLLILLESALSGAYVFKCKDACYRDISSVHGSYKRVVKTEESIVLVGTILQELKVAQVHWYLDSPISNSGRLKTMLLEIAKQHNFPWSVELVFNPDKQLAVSNDIVISSDGWILNECKAWFNLGAYLIENHLTKTNVIDPISI